MFKGGFDPHCAYMSADPSDRWLGDIGPKDSKPRQANSEGHISWVEVRKQHEAKYLELKKRYDELAASEAKQYEDEPEENPEAVAKLEALFDKANQRYRISETDQPDITYEEYHRVRTQVARVKLLHRQYRFAGDDTTDYCEHCNGISGGWVTYPCPTLRALTGE